MTTHTVTSSTAARREGTGARGLLVAAVAFSLAWILGLAIPVPSVALDASAGAALDAVVGHEGATAARVLLVHGVAAVAFTVVAFALARVTAAAQPRLARAIRAAALTAAGLSLTQLVLELVLAGPVAGARDAGAAGALTDAVNRLDGAKMFALAALALAGTLAAHRTGVLPRWLRVAGIALVVAIVASGIGYALLLPSLALAAAASLPLLLVWITGTGVVLARRAG